MSGQTSRAAVTALRSVEFGVRDVDAAARFYEDVWGLIPVARDATSAYLRASGAEQYAVAVHKRDENGLLNATFAAADRASVDALHEQINQNGGRTNEAPGALDLPGGGYGFTFTEPEGRTLRIAADVAKHGDPKNTPDRPQKVSHLVLNAADADRVMRFFIEALGFRKRDETARMGFLGCNSDHHSVAITRVGSPTLNHVAFEVPDFDSLMRGSGRVRRSGHELEWGIGRHGPGHNIFAYFIDPDEHIVEYTANIEQVDDSYVPHGPDYWKPPIPGNPDYWGFAALPSDRFEAAAGGTHRPVAAR
jgi:catechol 2,3-dioxygenase